MDTPVTPSIGLFHADKQTVEALGPVVQLAKSGFFYCTQGEMSLVLGNRAFEIHRGDIYIYPPLSKTYIRMLSDDLHGTVGVADFDFVFTLANSISNTQNHLYMRENPCILLNDEQRRRIEELIELIWRRERSQGSRSTNENNRLIYNQLLSSLGKALCCEIAEAYFFNHPIQPLKQDRKDRIFQSFIFSLSQNFRTHHSVSFYAAEQCLTPRYFSTIVREKSGRNALQWIMMFIIAEAKKLLDRVGLPEDPDTKVMDIGVGKQQLVEIAKALSKDVKLLILDEPTAALNDEDSAHLLDLVRQLRDEQGVTSIIITHKLNEVAAIADNVTIIRDGSTVGVMYVTPETPLDQEELIRKMVGRPLHNLYPNHPSNTPGEE